MPAQRMGVQLAGATLGVIGHGSIGARVAALGRAFGMTVLVHDPHKTVAEPGIRQAGMDELLAASDFVVLLAVASEETRHLMNAARFAGMKPTAYFVNVSRPMLVDEEALASALRFGQIAGAALNVGSAAEMMPPVVLGRLPNVVATPHVGGLTPRPRRRRRWRRSSRSAPCWPAVCRRTRSIPSTRHASPATAAHDLAAPLRRALLAPDLRGSQDREKQRRIRALAPGCREPVICDVVTAGIPERRLDPAQGTGKALPAKRHGRRHPAVCIRRPSALHGHQQPSHGGPGASSCPFAPARQTGLRDACLPSSGADPGQCLTSVSRSPIGCGPVVEHHDHRLSPSARCGELARRDRHLRPQAWRMWRRGRPLT